MAHPPTQMSTKVNLLRHDIEDLSRLPEHRDLLDGEIPEGDLEAFLVTVLCDLVLRDTR